MKQRENLSTGLTSNRISPKCQKTDIQAVSRDAALRLGSVSLSLNWWTTK
jgi:hypothetical protein